MKSISSHPSVAKLISDVSKLCIQNGVTMRMHNGSKVHLGNRMYSSGFFSSDPNGLELAVSTGVNDEKWLIILIHESCHLDQWVEDRSVFDKMDSGACVDDWISGKRMWKKKVNKSIDEIIKIELDCEKRSVKKIKKYKLPVDITRYTMMANTYMYFYEWMRESRMWIPRNKSLYTEEIIKHAPKKFKRDYSNIPPKLKEAFEKYIKKDG
jgi:hypothetical protein